MDNDQPKSTESIAVTGLSKTGPTMKRGKSKQDFATPLEFIAPLTRRFGPLEFDLAATKENAKTASYFGPDCGQDSLKMPWHKIQQHYGWLWLNPPFDDIAPWAAKCAAESVLGARILFLTPASVGSNWFQQWVRPSAHVIFLNGRICFDGKHGFPKDLMLSVYAWGLTGDSIWKWK